jgi:hypothetical protein
LILAFRLHAFPLAQKHREALTQELEARQERLQALTRAMRELETQRILMAGGRSGAAREVVQRTKFAERDRDLLPVDQLEADEGRGGGKGKASGGKMLPEAEVGLSSGARVWVSFLRVLLSPGETRVLTVSRSSRTHGHLLSFSLSRPDAHQKWKTQRKR